jgi:hypothetical protein
MLEVAASLGADSVEQLAGVYLPSGGGEGSEKRHVHTREEVLLV